MQYRKSRQWNVYDSESDINKTKNREKFRLTWFLCLSTHSSPNIISTYPSNSTMNRNSHCTKRIPYTVELTFTNINFSIAQSTAGTLYHNQLYFNHRWSSSELNLLPFTTYPSYKDTKVTGYKLRINLTELTKYPLLK